MPKTGRVETEKRLLMIQSWIVEGVQSSLIIAQILQKEWCKSERHAERMLKAARERWIRHEDEDIVSKRKLKVQELKQLKRSMKEPFKGTPAGIRAIVAIEKEIIKLEGIAMPIKIETTGKDGGPIQTERVDEVDYSQLTDEVLLAIINARKKAKA